MPLTAGPSLKTPSWTKPASAYRITVCRVAGDQAGRVDSWIWSVRLARTRSAASGACRAGHVRVNGVRVEPAHAVRAGDEVRLRGEGRERVRGRPTGHHQACQRIGCRRVLHRQQPSPTAP